MSKEDAVQILAMAASNFLGTYLGQRVNVRKLRAIAIKVTRRFVSPMARRLRQLEGGPRPPPPPAVVI